MLCLRTTFARVSNSPSARTDPVILEGLLRINSLVRGVMACSRASGDALKSSAYLVSPVTGVAPASMAMGG